MYWLNYEFVYVDKVSNLEFGCLQNFFLFFWPSDHDLVVENQLQKVVLLLKTVLEWSIPDIAVHILYYIISSHFHLIYY